MVAIFRETHNFKQENGPEAPLVVEGDEYYARYETESGYTVIYDDDLGLYCYALLHGGQFVSSHIPMSQPPPAAARPHLEEDAAVRASKAASKIRQRSPPDESG